jgi:hypothetical protein
MTILFFCRSLVQIKSHTHKKLKQIDAGENVYRRMEENRKRLESLVAEAHKRVGLSATDHNAKSKWSSVKQVFHHDQQKHHLLFRSIAVLKQIAMENGEGPFQVGDLYDQVIAI